MSYILGLDLGETSIGIAILDEKDKYPISLRNLGVRIFPDGRDETKEPLAVTRRNARGIRRNINRRNRRKEKLLNFLIKNELISNEENERKNLKSLDPYELRARALNEKLTLNELSRALIHINQRRGFLSNRKIDKDDENSSFKNAMKITKENIENSGFKTLGEYLYSLKKIDDHTCLRVKLKDDKKLITTEKIDNNTGEVLEENKLIDISSYDYFPSRELYRIEVIEILKKQAEYYPQLNSVIFDEDTKENITISDKIFDIIFYQRDLKPQDIGKCQFEPDEDRIAKAHPLFQKFRIINDLNNLEIYTESAGNKRNSKALEDDEKYKILNLLNKQKKVSFNAIRKELGKNDIVFNLEQSAKGEIIREELDGNSTDNEMRKYIKNWDQLDKDKQYEYVEKLLDNSKDDSIIDYFINENVELTDEIEVYNTKIDENGKKKKIKEKVPTDYHNLLDIKLENGYGNLSKKALEKILPSMEEGKKYCEACEEIYGSHSKKQKNKVYDELPYYGEILERSCIKQPNSTNKDEREFGKITNVTVHIALNQIRRVVNEIIEKYGKPSYIAIEIARELKMNKKDKAREIKRQNEDKKRTDEIKKELADLPEIKRDDIYKYKIWQNMAKEPLKRMCPFCGKAIKASDLFAPDSSYHIEHLLPFSRSYDDSINNKVISCSACNEKKGNRTPFEAFGHTDRWDDILSRVSLLPKQMQWRFGENAMAINIDNVNEQFWKDDYFGSQWRSFTLEKKQEICNILFDKSKDHKSYLEQYNLTEDQIDHIIEDFDSISKSLLARMLKDTQYLSKATAKYLECLYEDDGIRHIRVSPGRLTAMLRYNWGLENLIRQAEVEYNKVENKDEEDKKKEKKDRTDHRHHAIDAFVVACINNGTLNKISRASGKARVKKTDKIVADIETPYEGFDLNKIKNMFDNIIISFKADHKNVEFSKQNGGSVAKLNNETNYGLIKDKDGKSGIFATRISIDSKSFDKELIMNEKGKGKYIADDKIRQDLQELVKDVSDGKEIKKLIENYAKTSMKRKDGTPIVIKTLRIYEVKSYKSLMSVKDKYTGKKFKYAETDGNYCAEIYMPNRGKNEGKWCVEIISNINAHRKDFKPEWRTKEPEAKLIMRVFRNDMLEIEINEDNKDSAIKKLLPYAKDNKIITRVKMLTKDCVYLIPNLVAKENKKDELTWKGSGSGLQIANAKKIRVSPLGEITYLKK